MGTIMARKIAAVGAPFAEPISTLNGVSETGFSLPEDASFEDWCTIGRRLGQLRDTCLPWWIGDWWICAEHRYGERRAVVEAEDWQGPNFQLCAVYGSVARKFECLRRRKLLSFAHHREVASPPPAEADKLLDRCEAAIAVTGKPHSVQELREWRRSIASQPAVSDLASIDFDGRGAGCLRALRCGRATVQQAY
jgi:hypothetical protein